MKFSKSQESTISVLAEFNAFVDAETILHSGGNCASVSVLTTLGIVEESLVYIAASRVPIRVWRIKKHNDE